VPSQATAATKRVRVRSPRARVGASNDLNRMPQNGARVPAACASRRAAAAALDVLVLLRVGARAVAVLEVDPEVLDRLRGELGPHPRAHVLREVVGQASGPRERRVTAVRVQGVERGGAPARHERGVVAVGRDVDRVDRLAAWALAGVVACQRRVGAGQQRVELVGEPPGEPLRVDRHG